MKAYRIGFYLAGIAAVAYGLSKLVKGTHGRSEEDEREQGRKYFGDFYEEVKEAREPWDIPLEFSIMG